MYQPLLCGHEQFLVSLTTINEFPVHWHSEIEIVYCISGSFKTRINNNQLQVANGQAVFVSSAEEHEYLGSSNGTKVLVIEIGFSFLGENFSEMAKLQFTNPLINMDNPELIGQNAASQFKEYFQTLVSVMQNQSAAVMDEWETKAALFNIAALTMKVIPHKSKVSDKRKTRMQSILNIQPAFSLIKNNYSSNISIDDVAEVTGYEKTNFCKQFKAATQTSFHKYLNTYRIRMACNMLEFCEYPIQAIGEKVGIPEAKSFSRIFRQVIGMTPSQYKLERKKYYEQ